MSVTELVFFGLLWAVIGMVSGCVLTRDYLVKRYQKLLAIESEKVTDFSRAYSEQRDLYDRKDELMAQRDNIIVARLQSMVDKLGEIEDAKH